MNLLYHRGMQSIFQPGIMDGVPPVARDVHFGLADQSVTAAAIQEAVRRLGL